MTELSERLLGWMAGGRYALIDGVKVWHRVEGMGPWLVCLHGFPTSSRDFIWLLPLLRGHCRVLILDLPGFGLSGKPPGRNYSLTHQFRIVEALLTHLGIATFHLLAHDMGDTLACELLRRREQGETELSAETITLLNGGIYMDLHRPVLTQRLLRTPVLGELTARMASYRVFRRQYGQIHSDSDVFDEEHYREQWQLMQYNEGRRSLARVAGYMRERVLMGEHWLGPLHRMEVPLQLIWGMEDPVAVPAIARRLVERNPRAQLVELEDAGHYPQLEAPERVAAAVVRFIEEAADQADR